MAHPIAVLGICRNHLIADNSHVFTAIVLFPQCNNPHALREKFIHLQNDSLLYQLCPDNIMPKYSDFVSRRLLLLEWVGGGGGGRGTGGWGGSLRE